jgi:hypothetical protein
VDLVNTTIKLVISGIMILTKCEKDIHSVLVWFKLFVVMIY